MVARLSQVVIVLGLALFALAPIIAGPSYGVVQTIGNVTIALGLILYYWSFGWKRSAMSLLDRDKWEHLRSRGRLHYILVRCVLYWGVGTALVISAVQWLGNAPMFHPWPDTLVILTLTALAGGLVGSWTWKRNENLYWRDAFR